MKDRVKLDIAIPAGVDDGMRVRLTGEGEPSPDGGPRGDCYCFVTIRPHRLFQREGDHLLLRLPVTYSQAALGATIEVPTLTGRAELQIPAGTQSAELFRLRGRGMPNPRGGGLGDLVVQVYIEVPKKLTPRQEELLRELADVENSHVSPQRKSFLEKLTELFHGGKRNLSVTVAETDRTRASTNSHRHERHLPAVEPETSCRAIGRCGDLPAVLRTRTR